MAGHLNVLFIFVLLVDYSKSYELKQVLILSRHNIRAPLAPNLQDLSNNTWPIWTVGSGMLTAKGALLEGYMGNFISNWLAKKGLFPTGCPDENTVHVYANTRPRTKETAKAFVDSAFRNCNITVHSKNSSDMDPIFNPIIRTVSVESKPKIIKDMQLKLENLYLTDAYSKLNDIVNLKHAKICTINKICDFLNAKDDILYEVGEEPNVNGSLRYTSSIVDAFIMSYYEGMNINDIAWGNIRSPKEWELFMPIIRGYLDVRFNSTLVGSEAAKPLLKYIYDTLSKSSQKFALLVGHDSNLNAVMAALNFKPFVLPDQYELVPIGGKIIFQKWFDKETNKDLLKIEYVYQTMDQLRNGEELTYNNPPRIMTMEMSDCEADLNQFCLWSDFMTILKTSFS